jgi:hypothetical protein
MKKGLLIAFSMLFAGALLTGCKKEITQDASTGKAGEANSLKVGNNSSCKLTHFTWSPVFAWDFHYNEKGLADEWRIDLGFGYIQDFKLEYDKFNKLIKADGYDDFGTLIIASSFTYSGSQIQKQTWENIIAGTTEEVTFTHNSKGQIIRQDDDLYNTHALLAYDNMGNCIRSDYYQGSDIYFSDIYEFNSNVRNPLLTVSGIDFMFPLLRGWLFQ